MKKLFILVAIVACGAALPLNSQEPHDDSEPHVALQRPSPINPDILSDPRPAEKVTKITDPKEAAKFKRETPSLTENEQKPLLPTVQPHLNSGENDPTHASRECDDEQQAQIDIAHHRQKRDQNQKTDKQPRQGAAAKVAVKKDKPQPHNDHSAPASTAKTNTPHIQKQRQRRDVQAPIQVAEPQPLIHHDEDKLPHNQHNVDAYEHHEHHIDEHQPTKLVKRDIPVPLVPKYQHPEESPKLDEKQTIDRTKEKETETKKNEKNSSESEEKDSAESKEHNVTHHVPAQHVTSQQPEHPHLIEEEHKPTMTSTTATQSTEHPVVRPKPVPVSELFARPRQ